MLQFTTPRSVKDVAWSEAIEDWATECSAGVFDTDAGRGWASAGDERLSA